MIPDFPHKNKVCPIKYIFCCVLTLPSQDATATVAFKITHVTTDLWIHWQSSTFVRKILSKLKLNSIKIKIYLGPIYPLCPRILFIVLSMFLLRVASFYLCYCAGAYGRFTIGFLLYNLSLSLKPRPSKFLLEYWCTRVCR